MTTTIVPVAGRNVRYWWIFLLRGLLFIIAGVLTFRYPLESYVTLSIFFGVTMLFTGILELTFTLSTRKIKGWGWRLAASLIDLILGIILILDIGISMAVLPFLVSFWFLFRGITMLSFSGIVRNVGSTAWMITGGILLIFFAILIMINPVLGAVTIVTWTGLAFIVAGIFNIILTIQLKKEPQSSGKNGID
ncbi:hypothetical protein A4D02_21270 [Niastella koreensis]|uniref:HdeD family acid-resistance protein n=2 Tax=Niastella koreensis TaxID=354356 RepID=G8TJ84_NIAKG|nr:DUF308 domain-containing protein [Niastella koreensis]AEV98617.1 protein of unknown function DUF308 membrane [Niastella koreensis GR20-10]OQP52941.1 hypothetical protein A4D02_21270 [Niastella koreensis]